MPTKEELTNSLADAQGTIATQAAEQTRLAEENEDLKTRIKSLEDQVALLEADAAAEETVVPKVGLATVVKSIIGSDRYDDALTKASDQAGRNVDDFEDDEGAALALHVILAQDDDASAERGKEQNEKIEMLEADKLRLEIERNDAIAKLRAAESRERERTMLHGSVDTLRAPY